MQKTQFEYNKDFQTVQKLGEDGKLLSSIQVDEDDLEKLYFLIWTVLEDKYFLTIQESSV